MPLTTGELREGQARRPTCLGWTPSGVNQPQLSAGSGAQGGGPGWRSL